VEKDDDPVVAPDEAAAEVRSGHAAGDVHPGRGAGGGGGGGADAGGSTGAPRAGGAGETEGIAEAAGEGGAIASEELDAVGRRGGAVGRGVGAVGAVRVGAGVGRGGAGSSTAVIPRVAPLAEGDGRQAQGAGDDLAVGLVSAAGGARAPRRRWVAAL